MQRIVDGVHDFRTKHFREDQQLFERLASGQQPQVLLVTCSDSRIDPNLVTTTKPGDLFVLRTAGNIVPPYEAHLGGEAATIEYAVNALKIPDIIVCGHSHCGAMGGLLNPDGLSELPAVRGYLTFAQATRDVIDERFASVTDPAERLTRTVEQNTLVQLDNLRTHPAVAAALERGDLTLHAWVYQFESGDVFAYSEDRGEFVPLHELASPTA